MNKKIIKLGLSNSEEINRYSILMKMVEDFIPLKLEKIYPAVLNNITGVYIETELSGKRFFRETEILKMYSRKLVYTEGERHRIFW